MRTILYHELTVEVKDRWGTGSYLETHLFEDKEACLRKAQDVIRSPYEEVHQMKKVYLHKGMLE